VTQASELYRGATVEARDPSTGEWRPGILMQHEPYNHRRGQVSDGWYVNWTDLPKPNPRDPYYAPSRGGWQPVNCIRFPEASA
jgi:hypothetical protein